MVRVFTVALLLLALSCGRGGGGTGSSSAEAPGAAAPEPGEPVASAQTAEAQPKAPRPEQSEPPRDGPPPPPTYALPGDEAALRKLLGKPGEVPIAAIKGKLRSLEGAGKLSFDHIVILGASMSAGFGGTPLADAFAVATQGGSVENLASTFFFRAVVQNGAEQVTAALAAKPTFVVAADFLFWYVYNAGDLGWRMRRLESGLHELERISVPLVVGDLPDMRHAADFLISAAAKPSPEDLVALNRKIHQWARGRLNVHLVPLAAWSADLISDAEVTVVPGVGEKVKASTLMNSDRLHPNAEGVRYMLVRLGRSLMLGFPETDRGALRFE